MTKRMVVKIDEEKCNGCGLCVPSCAEGALQIIDGKARLVSEVYCDGLGACLGDCPQGAITMEEREAEEYDQAAVDQHLKEIGRASHGEDNDNSHKGMNHSDEPLPCGCPGTMTRTIGPQASPEDRKGAGTVIDPAISRLANWPLQLRLVPVNAPYLKNADLLISADCVPFAHPDFHERFVKGRIVLIGCPKLDDAGAYVEKLAIMFRDNQLRSIEVPYMEVPCCTGLVRIVETAIQKSGATIPAIMTKVSLEGRIIESRGI